MRMALFWNICGSREVTGSPSNRRKWWGFKVRYKGMVSGREMENEGKNALTVDSRVWTK